MQLREEGEQTTQKFSLRKNGNKRNEKGPLENTDGISVKREKYNLFWCRIRVKVSYERFKREAGGEARSRIERCCPFNEWVLRLPERKGGKGEAILNLTGGGHGGEKTGGQQLRHERLPFHKGRGGFQ